ncbi:ABC transporter substrate-binding protein, partial [Thermococci archaeon]
QIEKIQKADVIVTIGHLPLEEKIEELEKEGILKGEVLGIEDYQRYGFRYLPERWYNNKYNPHGIWLDPYNALAIAEATKEALKTRYSGQNIFEAQYSLFKAKVETIILAYQKMNLSEKQAIIELPSQQYALEWMGIEVIASIKPEEEIPAKSVDELLEMVKTVDVIVYSTNSPESLKNAVLELSRKTGVPTIGISTIWSEKEYTEVLIQNSANIVSAFRTYVPQEVPSQQSLNTTYIILAFIVGVTLGTAFGVIIKK